jgi:K+-sensing histidine kinase KdpD
VYFMLNYFAGVATGCLIGVSGAFLMLLFSSIVPEPDSPARRISFPGLASAIVAVLMVAFACYWLKLGEAVSMVFLLLSMLAVARVAGNATSSVAAVVSALTLSILFLPPVGSLYIVQSSDRLLMALFLLGAMIVSRTGFVERHS